MTFHFTLYQSIKIQFSQIQAFFGQATVINPKVRLTYKILILERIFFNLVTHTYMLQVQKSRTRIVDFDSSSDEEKEDGDKRENSEWREEVKTCLFKYISNSNWWQIWQNISKYFATAGGRPTANSQLFGSWRGSAAGSEKTIGS